MKRTLYAFLILAAVTTLVISCGKGEIKPDFIVANASEPTLDPTLQTDTASTRVYLALFEGLVQYDPKTSRAVPAVAESWDINDDDTIVTFHLRKNAKWSDGHSVTAKDFVYAMKRILDPATGAEYAYFPAMVVKGAEAFNGGTGSFDDVGYKALDDNTLQVTLTGPAPYAVDMMAHSSFGPIPQWAVEKSGNDWTKPGNIVTNGPFTLKEWKVQEYLLVVKDPKYWDAKNVKLKSIKFLPGDNDTTNYNMFKAGEIDWQAATVAVSKIDEIKLRKDFQVSPQVATYYISLNFKRKPFEDVRIRKALAMSIDKKTIVEKISKAGEIPTDSMVPALDGYTPAMGVGFDPEGAKKLLAEAGYPGGKGFPAFTYIYNTTELHKSIAEFCQQSWKSILGINCTLQNMEFKTLLDLRDKQRDFTVARNGWVGDYIDPNTMLELFLSNSGNNAGNYNNSEFDKLISDARTAKGPDRMKLLQQAESLLLTKDQACIPIFNYANTDMIDTSKWGGWFNNPIGFHPWKYIYKK